jgi:hypothetical protein
MRANCGNPILVNIGISQKSVSVSESTATLVGGTRRYEPRLTLQPAGVAYLGSGQRDGTASMPRHQTSFWTRFKMFLWRIFAPRKDVELKIVGDVPWSAGGASDPLVGVRQPNRRGPGGRTSAAAVMEPDDDGAGVMAVGNGRRGSHLDR